MKRTSRRVCFRRAVTIMELVIAVAIIAVIFAAILPQFAIIRNSWDVKQGTAEALQNGRVLMDHISHNLSKAKEITAVEASSIDFNDCDGIGWRYDISANKYVEYGQPGNLSDLAGPVSSLAFTCYSACDLNTPITDSNSRVVKVDATFPNSGSLGRDETFTTWAYLRANGNNPVGLGSGTPFEFDTTDGQYPALAQIDSTHYLCVYRRSGAGYAVVLTISGTTVTAGTPFQFDATGTYPDLAQIDSDSFLCSYTGSGNDGWAVVLNVNTSSWTISRGTPFEFDNSDGRYSALAKINPTHYLCAYTRSSAGTAVVLTVSGTTINAGTRFRFDTIGGYPDLAQIDSDSFLCSYTGSSNDGWAVVLNVNTSGWTISGETPLEFDPSNGQYSALVKVSDGSCADDWRCLCAYTGANNDGWSVVLNYTELKP